MNVISKVEIGAVVLVISGSILAQSPVAAPLPSVETVLKNVAEQARKENDTDLKFNARYSYTRVRVTEYRNFKDELKKRVEKNDLHKPTIAFSVKHPQRGEAKNPPSKKEDGKKQALTDTSSNARGKAFEKSDFLLNSNLLSRFEFALIGRETIRNRPVLVLDFKPARKNLPERNFKDRFINKAAGRAWVDEEDWTLAKADLHLTEKVNVLGGLVGSVWKFNYSFDRERTSEGLWFTRNVDWHLEGREVFLRRKIDYHEKKSDLIQAITL